MADELVATDKNVPDALEATRVTAEEVMARRLRGEPILFVDARAEDEWQRSHEKLPDALRLSLDSLVEGDTFPIIPRDRSIVTYCTSAHEESSASAAKILATRGYSDVHPLYGGLEAWRRAGGELSPR
jgi:rhodanese-related sulfurtransferase